MLRAVLAGLFVATAVGVTRYDLLRRPGGSAVLWLPLLETTLLVAVLGFFAALVLYVLAKRESEFYRLARWEHDQAVENLARFSRLAFAATGLSIGFTAAAVVADGVAAPRGLSIGLSLLVAAFSLLSVYAVRQETLQQKARKEAERKKREEAKATAKRRAREEAKRKKQEERDRYIEERLDMPRQTFEAADAYDLGVAKSKWAERDLDKYIVRDVDGEDGEGKLKDALESELPRFVIVYGKLKAGKSRTAFEVAQRLFPDAGLILPRRGHRNVMAELFTALFPDEPPPTGDPLPVLPHRSAKVVPDKPLTHLGQDPTTVVWLDRLEQYVTPTSDLDCRALFRILRERTDLVFVATITSKSLARLRELDEHNPARRLVDKAQTKKVIAPPSTREQKRAAVVYPELNFSHSIGEAIVAGRELELRYDTGDEVCQVGWCIVQAAIDWFRTGIGRPIGEAELRELSKRYVPDNIELDEQGYEKGLAWARAPIAAHEALLERVTWNSAICYQAHPHIVAYADGEGTQNARDIPNETWDFVLEQPLTADQCLKIGDAAWIRKA